MSFRKSWQAVTGRRWGVQSVLWIGAKMKHFNHHFSTPHQMNDFFFFFFKSVGYVAKISIFNLHPNSHFHSLKIGSTGQIIRGINSTRCRDELVWKFFSHVEVVSTRGPTRGFWKGSGMWMWRNRWRQILQDGFPPTLVCGWQMAARCHGISKLTPWGDFHMF